MKEAHWLETQVERLRRLAEAAGGVVVTRGTRSDDPRHILLRAVRDLVEAVVVRSGVTACVACYEGLPAAAAGAISRESVEAVAAMSQRLVDVAGVASRSLALGGVRQLVVVGAEHKVALLCFGPLAVAILSSVETDLAGALSR
jgi:predicted regulator of Ras-like GTPase activity (Roadblock/LC7/MglB family)